MSILDKNIPTAHISSVVEVIVTDEFSDWFRALKESEQDAIGQVVDMLE